MAKKSFCVTCTMIYNGSISVEAENESEAIEKANELLREDYESACDWDFGEATADYASEE